MILQKEYNRSAKWDKEKDVWSVEDKPRYRWTYIDDTPASEWYDELNDALKSIDRQTYKNLQHLVVVDGFDYFDFESA